MKKKTTHPNFTQTLELLRAHSFTVEPFSGAGDSFLVTKNGAGAVVVSAPASKVPGTPAVAYTVHPGVMVKGEVGRLLDRGYQKFIKSSQYEIPASAQQLQSIHAFSEELKLLTGVESLYNESLGTTSDVYRYDRLKGREVAPGKPAQPWELTNGH